MTNTNGRIDTGLDLHLTIEALDRASNPNAMGDSQEKKVQKEVIQLLESNQKEEINKALLQRLWGIEDASSVAERLFAIDQNLALQKIEEILTDKSSQKKNIQGAAIYMITSQGNLNLTKFGMQDSFLWYQALGGEIGDDLYTEQKTLAKAYDYKLTDEALLLAKIKPQRFDNRAEVSKPYKITYN